MIPLISSEPSSVPPRSRPLIALGSLSAPAAERACVFAHRPATVVVPQLASHAYWAFSPVLVRISVRRVCALVPYYTQQQDRPGRHGRVFELRLRLDENKATVHVAGRTRRRGARLRELGGTRDGFAAIFGTSWRTSFLGGARSGDRRTCGGSRVAPRDQVRSACHRIL